MNCKSGNVLENHKDLCSMKSVVLLMGVTMSMPVIPIMAVPMPAMTVPVTTVPLTPLEAIAPAYTIEVEPIGSHVIVARLLEEGIVYGTVTNWLL